MNFWLTPTPNVLINTFLRSLVVIAVMILNHRLPIERKAEA